MTALPPKTDTRIGTFGQTGTLRNFLHRSWPTPLKLFHGLQRNGPGFGDMGARSALACPLSGVKQT